MKSMVYTFLLMLCCFLNSSSYNLKAQTAPQFVNYTNGRNIKAINEYKNNLYIGTIGGFIIIDKSTLQPTFYNKSNSSIPGNFTLAIAIDSSGTIWQGTRNAGLGE
ncbi:MAG: hypothetical protein ACM3MI_15400, partial [Clostridiales bacterium]